MDVARSRYQSIIKQSHAGNASAAKTDNMRDEMEDTAHKVEQCRVRELLVTGRPDCRQHAQSQFPSTGLWEGTEAVDWFVCMD